MNLDKRIVPTTLAVSILAIGFFFGPSFVAPASDLALSHCSNVQAEQGSATAGIEWKAFPLPHWSCSSPDSDADISLGWWP
jgi:hypothetical protein